jgi:D-galacturonate reductase
MKILIVGAGMYVTGRHGSGPGTILASLAETSKNTDIETVVIAARRPENADAVADAADRINRTLGTRLPVVYRQISGVSTEDIPALCRETEFDGAIVAVPDHRHHPVTVALLREGIHCLVVKPLTPTLDEAKDLVRLQTDRGLHGAVEFHKRFDDANRYLKKALAEGRIGKILYVDVAYSQRISIPTRTFRAWSDKTNIFQYLGVHYVDLIYFLTGFLPVRAMGIGTDGTLQQRGIDAFDSIHAQIVWENRQERSDRFVTQFSTNWVDPECTSAMSDQKFTIVGTHGRIECNQKNRGIEIVAEETGIQSVNPYFSEFLPDTDGAVRFSGYGHLSIDSFVHDLVSLKERKISPADLALIRPTFKQALVSTAVIEAVNRSLAENSNWSRIDDPF